MGEALEKAKKARIASRELAQTSSSQRCDALNKMADALVARRRKFSRRTKLI